MPTSSSSFGFIPLPRIIDLCAAQQQTGYMFMAAVFPILCDLDIHTKSMLDTYVLFSKGNHCEAASQALSTGLE